MIPIDSNTTFKDNWNKIEDNNIDEISLLFHGQPKALIISESKNSYVIMILVSQAISKHRRYPSG